MLALPTRLPHKVWALSRKCPGFLPLARQLFSR